MSKPFYQPLKPFLINQRFGENKACVSTDGTNKYITCDGLNPPTGYKSLYDGRGHLGLDLRAYRGQEVYCAQDGVVVAIDTNPKTGLDVKVEHLVNGEQYRTIYEHLLGYQPQVKDELSAGELIGWANNTGYSSNDHLHWQVEKLINGVWVPVDPLPITENIFAKDILAVQNKLQWVKEQVALFAERLADHLRKK